MTHHSLIVIAASILVTPLAAQAAGTTPVSRGMEIEVRLPGDTAWHTVKVGEESKGDHSCLMVQIAPADKVTGDFYFRRFAGTVAVRTRNAKGEWQDLPQTEFEALQGCTLE